MMQAGFETSGLWIWSPTLYQLSHPTTQCKGCVARVMCTKKEVLEKRHHSRSQLQDKPLPPREVRLLKRSGQMCPQKGTGLVSYLTMLHNAQVGCTCQSTALHLLRRLLLLVLAYLLTRHRLQQTD